MNAHTHAVGIRGETKSEGNKPRPGDAATAQSQRPLSLSRSRLHQGWLSLSLVGAATGGRAAAEESAVRMAVEDGTPTR